MSRIDGRGEANRQFLRLRRRLNRVVLQQADRSDVFVASWNQLYI